MSLFKRVSDELITAMKARNAARVRALQGIKAQFLLVNTEKGREDAANDDELLKVLQKMAKQRKDSIEIFSAQNRDDLAQKEKEELAVIEEYLPKQMGEDEIRAVLEKIIADTGAKSAADVGKVMPLAMKEMGGKADGKTISAVLKGLLQ